MATPNNQAEQFYCSLLNKRKDILCPISTATEALSYSYMYCSQIGYTIKKKNTIASHLMDVVLINTTKIKIPWFFPDFRHFYQIPWLFPDWKNVKYFTLISVISLMGWEPCIYLLHPKLHRFPLKHHSIWLLVSYHIVQFADDILGRPVENNQIPCYSTWSINKQTICQGFTVLQLMKPAPIFLDFVQNWSSF